MGVQLCKLVAFNCAMKGVMLTVLNSE